MKSVALMALADLTGLPSLLSTLTNISIAVDSRGVALVAIRLIHINSFSDIPVIVLQRTCNQKESIRTQEIIERIILMTTTR